MTSGSMTASGYSIRQKNSNHLDIKIKSPYFGCQKRGRRAAWGRQIPAKCMVTEESKSFW